MATLPPDPYAPDPVLNPDGTQQPDDRPDSLPGPENPEAPSIDDPEVPDRAPVEEPGAPGDAPSDTPTKTQA
jgi:hypothetical protein